jgi:hypothetical protein
MPVPNPYPALGFNPAAGSVDTVGHMCDMLTKARTALEDAHTTVTRIANSNDAIWQGEAAQGFRKELSDKLPQRLLKARDSVSQAVGHLSRWRTDLLGFQGEAKRLDDEARVAGAAEDKARGAAQQAGANPDLQLAGRHFPEEQLSTMQKRLDTAIAALDQANRDVADAQATRTGLIRRAEELRERHKADADSVAKGLDTSDNIAPSKPKKSLWSKVKSAAGDGWDWISDLKNLGDVLAMASAVVAIAGLTILSGGAATPFVVAGGLSLLAGASHMADPKTRAAILSGDPGAIATIAGDVLGAFPAVGPLSRTAYGAFKAGTHVPGVVTPLAKASAVLSKAGPSWTKVVTRMKDTLQTPLTLTNGLLAGTAGLSTAYDVAIDLGVPLPDGTTSKAAVDGSTVAGNSWGGIQIVRDTLKLLK